MKIIFLAGHEFLTNQLIGGKHGSLRNYELLCNIYGEKNLIIVTFSNDNISNKAYCVKAFPKHKNKVQQFINCICMRNGYNWKTEHKVVEYISEIQPDLIFFDSSFTGGILNKIAKKINNKCKIIAYLHNVEMRHVWDKVLHESILYFIPFLSYYFNEKNLIKKADVIIGLNSRDRNEINKLYGKDMNFILPVTYRDAFQTNLINYNRNEEISILFVGAFFGPNNHGIRWFIKHVMVKLNWKIKLIVIGKDMERLKTELQDKNIDIIGTVKSTADYYYSSDIVIMPILYGNGMKTKTAEAMMYGKYILGTKEALEGYDILGINEIKECNSANDFVEKINAYSLDSNRSRYYESVRSRFLEKYETRSIEKDFKKFMLSL